MPCEDQISWFQCDLLVQTVDYMRLTIPTTTRSARAREIAINLGITFVISLLFLLVVFYYIHFGFITCYR